MKNSIVFFQAYPARIGAIEALIEARSLHKKNADRLRDAANSLDATGPLYGRASAAAVYGAFADLLRLVALLVEWRKAVLDAEMDADRFLRAAKARYGQWLKEYSCLQSATPLLTASHAIKTMSSTDEVSELCLQIAKTPLPIGMFSVPDIQTRRQQLQCDDIEGETKEIPDELAIAFIRFQIDSQPAAETHFLTPNETHDLEVEVRISRWPDHATQLLLTPISIEARGSYDFPVFKFQQPSGKPPYTLQSRGRALLNVAQGLNAQPYEFKYAAAFLPDATEQPVAVVGQRTLRIEGFDLVRNPITGYSAIDRKIVQVRDQIRTQPGIDTADLASLLLVLKPICSLAGRSIQDALFKNISSEAGFQAELRDELRRDPHIGAELEEHPAAAGGFTDLSFRRMRIELKFSSERPMTVSDCDKFIEQTMSYVVGTGKRIGVLCVLDNSKKNRTAFPAEEGVLLRSKQTEEGLVNVIVILIQGGIARPSDLSR